MYRKMLFLLFAAVLALPVVPPALHAQGEPLLPRSRTLAADAVMRSESESTWTLDTRGDWE